MAEPDSTDRLALIRERLREFARARDWGQFHSPKNLVMALTGEVGELTEHFQWLTEQESRELCGTELDGIREEIADVQIYLLMLSEKLGIDLLQAVEDKIARNEQRYPAERVRGSRRKYSES
ncbi:nucleotide pyrophosphohydrolase [Litchfieldella qijiaojingensis]|uniref:Nucleotide pyrophosphohydrolase n=1 Tax=Litchfieldella qijiaojingensis TaxID=980347 RepID=A0ABQ2YQL0_9GAMM|nr:nucleotide pyrophosphohydrolase [Halomonas qijiaojingensis]GGX89378.1 nucleotide pyrophosphohydrolase [Halomonas qijiaojingensis]